jgi:hypothetical protein
MEVIVNPDQTDKEFYAELYFDVAPAWKIIEVID